MPDKIINSIDTLSTEFFSKFFKIKSNNNFSTFKNLGFVDCKFNETLTFAENEKFFDKALNNDHIVAIISNLSSDHSHSKSILFTEQPRNIFYEIHNYLLKNTNFYYTKTNNKIKNSSKIHNSCFIGKNNISIGNNVVIGPNVCIFNNTEIEDNVKIKANSVIGGDGFQSSWLNDTLFSIPHAGGVHIKKGVEVGSNSCIDKGLFKQNTTIDVNTKIDNLVHIAHNVTIGKNCTIVANSLLGGSSVIGDHVHIAMSSTIRDGIKIGNNVKIGMGSVVTKDVPANLIVYGNPASRPT